MSLSKQTNYSGEVVKNIFTQLVTDNELVTKGIVNIIENVGYGNSVYIPRLESETVIQARSETPVSSGSTSYKEEKITLEDLMVYQEFNPKTFENIWREYQVTGQLIFEELPEEVQSKMLSSILGNKGKTLSKMAFQGDKASGATAQLQLMDGFIAKALSLAGVVDVASAVALTSGNIVSKFDAIYDATDAAVRGDQDFKYLVSQADAQLYFQAQKAQANKGVDFTSAGVPLYNGIPVVSLNSVPKDTVMATRATAGADSNLHLGAGQLIDHETFLLDKVSNAGELFFAKMLFKAGVGIAKPSELTLYKG